MLVLVTCMTMLLPMATSWPIQIDDISLEHGEIVVATCGPHRILRVPWAQVKVSFRGTGLPMLDDPGGGKEATKRFGVQVLDSERLILLDDTGGSLESRMDSSIGSLRICLWRAPLCTGVQQVPAIAILHALFFAVMATAMTEEIQVKDILIIASISIVLAVILRRRTSTKTALFRRISDFRRSVLCNGMKHQPCPRGPGRAVTIGQLLEFFDYFQAFIRNRDMYYTSKNLIRPVTKQEQLSYSEIVGPSHVLYFVSHYWGSQTRYFVDSIQKHAQQARVQNDWRDISYWICSFSNNQWNLQDELSTDCEESSFYLALRDDQARGTVMVLDEKALPLTRSWCLFELLQTFLLRDERAQDFEGLSLCTPLGVLSKGAAGVDIAMGLAQRLAVLDLKDATASKAEDKDMIDDRVRSMSGGFPAINEFVRLNIRDALLRVRDSFEADFNGIVAALDRCSDSCESVGEPPPADDVASEAAAEMRTLLVAEAGTRSSSKWTPACNSIDEVV